MNAFPLSRVNAVVVYNVKSVMTCYYHVSLAVLPIWRRYLKYPRQLQKAHLHKKTAPLQAKVTTLAQWKDSSMFEHVGEGTTSPQSWWFSHNYCPVTTVAAIEVHFHSRNVSNASSTALAFSYGFYNIISPISQSTTRLPLSCLRSISTSILKMRCKIKAFMYTMCTRWVSQLHYIPKYSAFVRFVLSSQNIKYLC